MKNPSLRNMILFNRRTKRLIPILLLTLCVMMLEMTFIQSDSMEKSITESRKDAYGEWQAAVCQTDGAAEKLLSRHPWVEAKGAVTVGDALCDIDDQSVTFLGRMDEAAIQLLRIQLYEGTWPRNGNEAVVEACWLPKLGLDQAVGEEITLRVLQEDGQITERRLLLAGIMENYEINSNLAEASDVPGIILGEEGNLGSRQEKILLIRGKEGWTEMEADLLSMGLTGSLVENTNAYSDREADPVLVSDGIRYLVLLAAGMVMLAIAVADVRSRSGEWRQLLRMGAEIRQLQAILFYEALGMYLIALVLGTGLALGCIGGIFRISREMTQLGLQMEVSLRHLLLAVGMSFLTMAAGYLYPILRIEGYADPESSGSRVRNKKVRHLRVDEKYSSAGGETMPERVFRRGQRQLRRWYLVVRLTLITMVMVFFCLGFRGVSSVWSRISVQRKNFGSSYVSEYTQVVGYSAASLGGVPGEAVQQLADCYGVGEVLGMYRLTSSDYAIWADVSGIAQDTYYKAFRRGTDVRLSVMQEIPAEITGEARERMTATLRGYREMFDAGRVPITVWGIDDAAMLQRLGRNVDLGELDLEAFEAGEEAILMLPDYLVITDAEGTYSYNSWKRKPKDTVISAGEGELRDVTLFHGEEQETAAIRAVITSVEEADQVEPLPYEAYTLIVSKAFLERFTFIRHGGKYQYVQVKADSRADYTTDRYVMRRLYVSGMETTNYREKLAALEEEFFRVLSLWSLLWIGVAGLAIGIRLAVSGSQARSDRVHDRILQQMGMSPGSLVRSRIGQSLAAEAGGILCSVIILSGVITWQINRSIEDLGRRKAWAIRTGLPLGGWLLLTAAVLAAELLVETRGIISLLHEGKEGEE